MANKRRFLSNAKKISNLDRKMPTCRNWIILSFMRKSDGFWHEFKQETLLFCFVLFSGFFPRSAASMAGIPSAMSCPLPSFNLRFHCEHWRDGLEVIFKLFFLFSLSFLFLPWLLHDRHLCAEDSFFLQRFYSTWLVCRSISVRPLYTATAST